MTEHINLYIPLISRKNMNKKLFLLGFVSIFLLVFALNTVSALHGHGAYINSYSSHSTRTYGYEDNLYTRTTDYNRDTISRYLSDGSYEKTTTYTRTIRESPRDFFRYYDSRPGYSFGSRFGNYYDRPIQRGYGFGSNRLYYNSPYY